MKGMQLEDLQYVENFKLIQTLKKIKFILIFDSVGGGLYELHCVNVKLETMHKILGI